MKKNVKTYNGKKISDSESLCYTSETYTILWINYVSIKKKEILL